MTGLLWPVEIYTIHPLYEDPCCASKRDVDISILEIDLMQKGIEGEKNSQNGCLEDCLDLTVLISG